jgi:hypothetical protein
MNSNEFCSLTSLAQEFEGQTSHTVGRALKKIELRWPNGKPTPMAHALGLVERHEGPQPWIDVWWWKKEQAIPFLEGLGMKRKEAVQNE